MRVGVSGALAPDNEIFHYNKEKGQDIQGKRNEIGYRRIS